MTIHLGNGSQVRVLKAYQCAAREGDNRFARWHVWATSPGCPEGEMSDAYSINVMRDICAAGCVAELLKAITQRMNEEAVE